MALPVPGLASGTVEIDGTAVPIRSLSRDEVVALSALRDDTAAAEVLILSRACSITEDEAREWRTKVDAETAGLLLSEIAALSGLARGNA
jgi:hypothetical protein